MPTLFHCATCGFLIPANYVEILQFGQLTCPECDNWSEDISREFLAKVCKPARSTRIIKDIDEVAGWIIENDSALAWAR